MSHLSTTNTGSKKENIVTIYYWTYNQLPSPHNPSVQSITVLYSWGNEMRMLLHISEQVWYIIYLYLFKYFEFVYILRKYTDMENALSRASI